jgi:hypothetical protein
MEKNNSKENNTREINLLELISRFFDWIKNVGKAFLNLLGYFFRLSYRHKILFIVSILICLGISQYLSRPSVRIYKAGAIAMLYGSEAQTAKEVSRQLENSFQSDKLTSLSTKLSLPDSVAKNIVGVQSFYVIDYLKDGVADMVDFKNNHSLTDTLNVRMRDRIYLQFLTKNINQVPQVQTAILKYFNNNPEMQVEFQISKSGLAEKIALCNSESKRIDSLAKVSYFKDNQKQLQLDKNSLIIGEQKKQLFYGDLIQLLDIKTGALRSFNDYVQPMCLPSNFVISPAPINGPVKYGFFGIILGAIIAIIIAEFIEKRKDILSYLKK